MHTIALLVLLCLLPACAPPTMEDRFHDFAGLYCDRLVACSITAPADVAECSDAWVARACSAGRDCESRDYYLDHELWIACLDAMTALDCAALEAGRVPASCANAWRPPGHRL